ncbi:MAG: hypothetical protein ABW104_14400 [Candidatus Thiodiazotropha sp. 6PLUC2]
MLLKNAHVDLNAPHPAALWVERVSLDPLQVDCITAQMLAILDNHCKLGLEDQLAVMAIYSVVKDRPGLIFGGDVHQTIEKARLQRDNQMVQKVRDLRLNAERRVPKQVMSHFQRFLAESLSGFSDFSGSMNA